jgi:hypothetical protein
MRRTTRIPSFAAAALIAAAGLSVAVPAEAPGAPRRARRRAFRLARPRRSGPDARRHLRRIGRPVGRPGSAAVVGGRAGRARRRPGRRDASGDRLGPDRRPLRLQGAPDAEPAWRRRLGPHPGRRPGRSAQGRRHSNRRDRRGSRPEQPARRPDGPDLRPVGGSGLGAGDRPGHRPLSLGPLCHHRPRPPGARRPDRRRR